MPVIHRAVLKQLDLESSPFKLRDYDLTQPLVRICTHPFDRQWLDTLPPSLRF